MTPEARMAQLDTLQRFTRERIEEVFTDLARARRRAELAQAKADKLEGILQDLQELERRQADEWRRLRWPTVDHDQTEPF